MDCFLLVYHGLSWYLSWFIHWFIHWFIQILAYFKASILLDYGGIFEDRRDPWWQQSWWLWRWEIFTPRRHVPRGLLCKSTPECYWLLWYFVVGNTLQFLLVLWRMLFPFLSVASTLLLRCRSDMLLVECNGQAWCARNHTTSIFLVRVDIIFSSQFFTQQKQTIKMSQNPITDCMNFLLYEFHGRYLFVPLI